MKTFNDYCLETFGGKLYKLSLNGGMTCPNRDGTLGTRGCIFCSAGGSGEFTPEPSLPVEMQIRLAKEKVAGKYKGSRYIAYFQAYTNTYASVDKLKDLYFPVIERPDIAALDIATRPDCLPDEVLKLIGELTKIKPVFVELGLQTSNEKTAEYIRRGYALPVYDRAVSALNALGVHTVTHVILGLPGEDMEDMKNTVRHAVLCGTRGIKLQLLHVLKGTDLAADWACGAFQTLSLDGYIEILKEILPLIPEDTVIHRLTGDGPKSLLLSPLWSADKKRVLNRIHREVL